MRVTHVPIRATKAALEAGRTPLTPEMLAATGARYSRNNEGLSAILSRVDFGSEAEFYPAVRSLIESYRKGDCGHGHVISSLMSLVDTYHTADMDKGVDAIFKMVDYGHASIADMSPVAMFLDGISMFAAYYIFSISPTGGGQESSTRYLKLGKDGLMGASDLGVKDAIGWEDSMTSAFGRYDASLSLWEALRIANPLIARIPTKLLDDPSPKAQKTVDRMAKNYAFDRARYFIPLATSNNMMLVQSARAWVGVISHLLSHQLPEFVTIGEKLRDELNLVTPRLTRHAVASRSTSDKIVKRFQRDVAAAREIESSARYGIPRPSVRVALPKGFDVSLITPSLEGRDNRYSLVGDELCRAGVSFGWEAVAMAEIRDLNRHRTGNKYCPLVPQGFYGAEDELPSSASGIHTTFGQNLTEQARAALAAGDPTYIYYTLMGTQFPFEHATTVDKFIYEAELRTGMGAHFRYAKHLREAMDYFYAILPETRHLVMLGEAEPE
jgi:thymidylate synthase ThyX